MRSARHGVIIQNGSWREEKKPVTECERREKEARFVKSRRAISVLIAFPPRRPPGSPSLRVGRRVSPRVVINNRRRLVSQLRWWIRVLRVVCCLVLIHVMVVRRARGHGERVYRDRLRTVRLRRLGQRLRPPTLARRLVLGWRRNVPGRGGW